jgi:transposase
MSIIFAKVLNQSGYRSFKYYYLHHVLSRWRAEFPGLVSYNQFVELMSSILIPLCFYLYSRKGKDTERKVFLILDNLPVHHGKEVKKWLEKNKERMAVFYLPSHSPELNPDEYLNSALKERVHSGSLARNELDLMKKTRSFMKRLQKRPEHIRKYFKHHNVPYAA